MKCVDMSMTGLSLLVGGGGIVAVRKFSYANDYSTIGSVITIVGVLSGVVGLGMVGLAGRPENCEGAGFF